MSNMKTEEAVGIPSDMKDDPMDVSETKKKKRGKKRKSDSAGSEHKKKKSKLSEKNALMALNEQHPGLSYTIEEQCGPPHDPSFVMSVVVEGQTFYGKGSSKQLAKHAAAEGALAWILAKEKSAAGEDSENISLGNQNNANIAAGDKKNIVLSSLMSKTKIIAKLQKLINEGGSHNPLRMLHEVKPGLAYTLVKENASDPFRRFSMSVTIDGCAFEASGPNKKAAKNAVARLVLCKVYDLKLPAVEVAPELPNNNLIDESLLDFPQNVAEKIAKCLNETFDSVMQKDKEHVKWKVLAGFVMTKDEDMEDMQVISFATGTKHLNGEYISMTGSVVNDCHAEIVSRRCLKDYFFSQLELHFEGKSDQSIFERKRSGKFGLLPNLKFHLFISTSPCGDARIFSVHSEDDPKAADTHPNRKARGLLRTKIESGEGTIPVKVGMEHLTWDGILEGLQRYLNMSCSDKIASWNVLGLQGSLLSNFIEPIYLESIVLGKLFHAGHLYRALCGRFMSTLKPLPPPFRLHKPKMCAVTNTDTQQLTKAPGYCANWTVGLDHPEIVVSKTGKAMTGGASRLAKHSFYRRFGRLYNALSPTSSISVSSYTYAMAKKLNLDYVAAKDEFVKAFLSAGLGAWVKKPYEEGEFEIAQ